MTKLTVTEAQNFAAHAGFSTQQQLQGQDKGYSQVQVIVAIAMAESGLNTDSVNTSDPNGGSYGILQINGFWFSHGISKSGALDPQMAFSFSYTTISQHGTNFNDWGTYTSKKYRQFLDAAGLGLNPGGQANDTTIDQLFQNKHLYKWWSRPGQAFGQIWGGEVEHGQDFDVDYGTPIAAVLGGKVVNIVTNNNSIGYVIQIVTTDGLHHYQHIATSTLKKNDVLNSGDIVGLSGGLPADAYSSGPHIEFRWAPDGFTNKSDWNSQNWQNPVPHLYNLVKQTPGNIALSSTVDLSATHSVEAQGFTQTFKNIGLSPTAGVASTLDFLNQIMVLNNPFDNIAVPDNVTIAGQDTGVPNPFEWLTAFSNNLFHDFVAILIRLVFIFAGWMIIVTVFQKVVLSSDSAQAVEKIGAAVA